MSKKTFIHGALILTVAGIIGKFLGAAYRIPFNRMVGPEISGVYGMSYSIYSIIFALSTAGIPLAVSKMIAVSEERENTQESLRIFKVSLLILLCIGCVCSLVFYMCAPWLAYEYFHEPRALLSLRVLAPAMFFSCLMSVFRGFFQGKQNMFPTAVSQILEQFFRVGMILIAVYLLLGESTEVLVAGASFGSVCGGLVALLFLVIFFIKIKSKFEFSDAILVNNYYENNGQIAKQLFYYAIPISIGALMLPIMQFIDSSIIVRRLDMIGFSHSMSVSQFGYISNYAMPIINLPFIVTTAIAASLVPAIADAWASKSKSRISHDIYAAMSLTIIIMLPASMGLACLGKPICAFLYDDANAGVALSYVAFTVLVVGIYQVTAAVLQGLGKVLVPMASLLLGASIKIGLTWILPSFNGLGIRGAALATVIGFSFAAMLNILILSKFIGYGWLNINKVFFKPITASLIMAGFLIVLSKVADSFSINASIITLTGLFVGSIIYFAVLLFLGGIEKEVISKLPKIGSRLLRFIEKRN